MNGGKQAAAEAALESVQEGSVLGVGTGSTVNAFIDLLAERRIDIKGGVASSVATAERLKLHRIEVLELNDVGPIELYVDGADEVNPALELIKGGGGALTREKIVAAASREFLCIVDDSKRVPVLGEFPLPIEVLPMARSQVAREIVRLGADPEWRDRFRTDNGNVILDCHGWRIESPCELESTLNDIPGVVTVGLFARRPADRLIVGYADGRTECVTRPAPPEGES